MAQSTYYGPHVAMRGMEPAYRLWGKFRRDPSGCWLWTAAITDNGYGVLVVDKVRHFAHRFAYELIVGPVPDGLHLDHLCRVRHCCNPLHLEPVTCAENVRRGQGHGSETHCPQGHEYAGGNVRLHVDKSGRTRRHCRTCGIERARRWREERKAS